MLVIFLLHAFLFFRCFPLSECINAPIFVWPLKENTSLYEVMHNNTQESLCMYYNETYGDSPQRTLSLYDHQPYIDLNVASESFVHTSIALAFKPRGQANGTLFHYKHTGGDAGLVEFRIRFAHDGTNTVLKAKRCVGTSSVERDFTSGSTIAEDQWHFLVFVIKYSTVNFMIYLNSETFDDSATFTFTNKRLDTPGVLRLGADLDSGNDVFRGSVTCLALFKDLVVGGDKTEILEFCSRTSSWKFIPPLCLDDPELAWPLTQNTSVYEVIEGGVAQINQCVVYNETHDILNRKTPYLSADHPYIDLNVESESFDDFCLTIAFKPKAIATGTLFDYRHTGSDDEVTEFRLAFTYDGSKTVLNARRKVDGTATIKLFTSAYTITNSQWHFLVFNIKSSVSFTIYLNSEIFSESPAGGDKRLETPGIIRLGAHLDTGANQFRGSLTCLCFFKDFLTISQKSQILNFCINKNIWNNNPPSIIQEHCPVPTVLPDSTTSSTVTTTNEATTTTSTTNEATTVVPTTDEATTIVPTTDEATTNAPTTDEATINVPTTNEATTIVPTTDEATTNMPSTNEATSIMSTTSEPTTCPTTTVEITTIAPTTDETTTSAPTTNIITTIMSTTTTTVEATTNAPTTDETTTSVPTTNEATTNILTTNEATTDTPTTNEETTNTPTTNEATSIKSTTSEATSSAPTTGEVTTSVPTTNEATTNMLTTIEATTDAPTTNQGTTITSTTNETTSNMTSQTISTSTTNQTPTPAFTTNGATTMTTQPPLPIPYNFFGYFKKAPAGIPNLLPTAMYVARSKYYCATYCISTSFDCQSFSVISSAGMFHCGLYHTIYTTGLTILPNAVYYHRKLV